MIRSRIVSILAVLPLVCGLVFVAYYFGPGPTAVAVPVAKNGPSDGKPINLPAAKPDQNSQVFKLFGIHDKEIARGRADSTPGDYLNSLETVYKQRGYQKLVVDNPATKGKLKRRARVARKAGAQKFFIRQESDGAGSIWATGVDADHTTAQEATEPFSFTTLVTKSESGGAEWVAYRMQVDQGKLQQLGKLNNDDFPGTDPLHVPRPKGMQRIYAAGSARGSIVMYKSHETETALLAYYIKELPRSGWNLDTEVTANANKVTRGVMCFTMGPRFCMIWITPGKEPNTSTVTISSY